MLYNLLLRSSGLKTNNSANLYYVFLRGGILNTGKAQTIKENPEKYCRTKKRLLNRRSLHKGKLQIIPGRVGVLATRICSCEAGVYFLHVTFNCFSLRKDQHVLRVIWKKKTQKRLHLKIKMLLATLYREISVRECTFRKASLKTAF